MKSADASKRLIHAPSEPLRPLGGSERVGRPFEAPTPPVADPTLVAIPDRSYATGEIAAQK